jgi:deoxyribodipyrimidine photolyase
LQRGYREERGDFLSGNTEQNPQSLRDSSFGKELNETLLNELIWREFWYQIGYYFPFTYQLEFQERRRSIVWKTDTNSYEYEKFEK